MCVCVWATLPDLNKMEWNGKLRLKVHKLTKLTESGKLFQTLTILLAKKLTLTLAVHLGLYNL